jgi:serine/threonine protein kinase
MIDVMDALCYLHERRLLHRDIKCDNVLLRKDMTALLSDFGLSKSLSSGHQETCSKGVGTSVFKAPEVSNVSKDKYSYPADIYSFGMMCMELLLGDRPKSRMQGLFRVHGMRSQQGLYELDAFASHCTKFSSSARPCAEEALVWLRELLEVLQATPSGVIIRDYVFINHSHKATSSGR